MRSSIIPLIIAAILTTNCESRQLRELKRAEVIMDTLVEVTVRGDGHDEDISAAFDEIRKIEFIMSRFDAVSELSMINDRAGGGPISVSGEMWEVLAIALDVAEKSGGAFDPTVGPAVDVWSSACCDVPDKISLAKVGESIGWEKIKIYPGNKISLEPGMSLNLDGVAKGYASDLAVETLKKRGCKAAMVNAGGDIRCYAPQKYPPWIISIEGVDAGGGQKLQIWTGAVATSGTGKRFNVIKGKKFSHVLDPRTLLPVSGEIANASAYAPTAAQADAWATAALVDGEDIFKAAETAGIGIAIQSLEGNREFNSGYRLFIANQ